MGLLWAFLLYALISFVASYMLVEYGQKYLYDELPPFVALRVAAGALIMAGLLTWTRSSFETMFTSELWKTALMALAWVGVFVLIYRFQPLHGAAFALATVLLLPGLASIVVQSVTTPGPDQRSQFQPPRKLIRQGTGGVTAPAPKEAK